MNEQESKPQKKQGFTSTNFKTYSILFLCIGAMTFLGVCTPSGSRGPGGLKGIAGSVDGEDILHAEFLRTYEQQSRNLRNQYGEHFDASALKIADQVLSQLIEERILYKAATEIGFDVSDVEVVDQLKDVEIFKKDGAYSKEAFKEFLRNNQYTESSLLNSIKRDLAVKGFRETLMSTTYISSKLAALEYKVSKSTMNLSFIELSPESISLDVSPSERDAFLAGEGAKDKVSAYYNANKAQFVQEERVRASHILISFKGADKASPSVTRSKSEALTLAKNLEEKTKKAPESFEELAKENTDEPRGKTSGGDIGFFTASNMVKEFSEAAFKLKVGEISSVVETAFGYHIIKLTEHKDALNIDLEKATPEIATELVKREKASTVLDAEAEKVLVSAKANDATQTWQETGDFHLSVKAIPKLSNDPAVKQAAFTLTQVGSVYPSVIKIGKKRLILKLKALQKSSEPKEDDVTQMKSSLAYEKANADYEDYVSTQKKRYEKKIEKSAEYLALDRAQTNV